jgi:carbon-monoxide dehydrogenase medium subunit
MQVPAPFVYERASSVEEALALLARHGDEARLVAGGHSLLPMMKLRFAAPTALIDVNNIDGLADIRVEGDGAGGHIHIGAMVRHAQLLESAVMAEHYPMFAEAERVIADPVVRNRGTVGGSLCQADPAEDLSAAFAAVRATVHIVGPGGTRTVPVREFHEGPYQTACGDDEMVTAVTVPLPSAVAAGGAGSAYEKVERRVGDWAIAAAGVAVWLDGETITEIGIGLTAVEAPHFVAEAAEDAARGQIANEDLVNRLGELAAEATNPNTDQRGPADYKRHLAGELTKRAMRRALGAATGSPADGTNG